MKATIEVEKFDNGITLKWKDINGAHDPEHVVAYDREKETVLGKMVWDDIRQVMESQLCSRVVVNVEYQGVGGKEAAE